MAVSERDLDALVARVRWPSEHRKRIRTTNLLERTFVEVRRRTKVIGRLPGETSALSLIWAVLELASRGWRGVVMTPSPLDGEAERRLLPEDGLPSSGLRTDQTRDCGRLTRTNTARAASVLVVNLPPLVLAVHPRPREAGLADFNELRGSPDGVRCSYSSIPVSTQRAKTSVHSLGHAPSHGMV